MSLSAELAGLAAGTYDICADSITISEERLENIYITDPLMQDEYYMIVRRDPVEVKVPKAPLFFKNIQNSIRLVFEYSDTDGGNIDMKVTYPGQDQNPLEDGDTLSLALIRHACQKLDWQYRDGVCRIEGNLVHT